MLLFQKTVFLVFLSILLISIFLVSCGAASEKEIVPSQIAETKVVPAIVDATTTPRSKVEATSTLAATVEVTSTLPARVEATSTVLPSVEATSTMAGRVEATSAAEEVMSIIITIQVTPDLAQALHESNLTSEVSEELFEIVDSIGLELEPLHPGTHDPTLQSYFMIKVRDPDVAQGVVDQLLELGAVEAAYIKPPDETP